MENHNSILLVSEVSPGVRLLRLNRPAQRNALNTELLSAVVAALQEADAEDAIKVVVISGGERVFAAGADVREMVTNDMVGMLENARPQLWRQIASFSKPLIAAVNGFALGAGSEMIMHADIVIAGETTKIGQPEINLGIMPGAGGTQRLIRTVGKPLAMKMVLSGETISAAEALAAGLVAEVAIPEMVEERAFKLAKTIASKPALAVRQAKQSLLAAFETTLQAGLALEQQAFVMLAATEDRNEGISAFLEKRKPSFKGR